MNYASNAIIAATGILLWQFATIASAQESTNGSVEAWQTLDSDFRQAMIEEISARRGLDADNQNPDWLIHSAQDIAEAFRLSCELSGACADVSGQATLGVTLGSFPEYDEQQGLLNAEIIIRSKMGNED